MTDIDELALRIRAELQGYPGTGKQRDVQYACRLLAAWQEGRKPFAWGVESSHSGEVVVRETFDDEQTARLHCLMNGGVVLALYTTPIAPNAATQDTKSQVGKCKASVPPASAAAPRCTESECPDYGKLLSEVDCYCQHKDAPSADVVKDAPITKACGKDDCRYSFERCGRVCFECHQMMADFGD